MNRQLFQYVAMVSMLLDHIGCYLMPESIELRILGRFALPAYVYLAYHSFVNTDRSRYFIRLVILGLFAQASFSVLNPDKLNVLFTFFFALFGFQVYQKGYTKTSFFMILCLDIIPTDYPVWFIFSMLICFSLKKHWMIIVFVIVQIVYSVIYNNDIQSFALLTIPLLLIPQLKLPSVKPVIWRWFYPVHLFILLVIRVFMSLYFV